MSQARSKKTRDDVSIVLGGGAGQGIQTIESILTTIFKQTGHHVFAVKEYMSRIRGGLNTTEIRISGQAAAAYVERIDILLPMEDQVIEHVHSRITPDTIIIGEKGRIGSGPNSFEVPVSDIAREFGNKLYSNTIMAGIVVGLCELSEQTLAASLENYFAAKDEEIIRNNLAAGKKGVSIGQRLRVENNLEFPVQSHPENEQHMIISGSEAVALGALAGGCNFCAAYPMSPATGVFTFLAQHCHDFGVIVEQVEDEISAINMALGSWYAGGRALVSTSGGGFALMTEGVSLAGMLELPLVVHLGQRPGPATGLPTRTEQGDLELVLHGGHGEFPRLVLAPVSVESAYTLMQRAFLISDACQVPVFVLTDQFFLDAMVTVPGFTIPEESPSLHIIKTEADYCRYKLTDDGVSPRGIPGFGQGIVCVDSDEHDERGQITESAGMRTMMTDKRLKKMERVKDYALPPLFYGPDDYSVLVLCWGSNYKAVCEAHDLLGPSKLAVLCCEQLFPVPLELAAYTEKADTIVCLENNATGQFARLLKAELGIEVQHCQLKYDGMPFSVEEIFRYLENYI